MCGSGSGSYDILALKIIRRKNESLWRRTRLTIHYDLYIESCMAVKKTINESKSQIFEKKINECHGDQKKLFGLVDTMIGRKKTLYCQNMMIQLLWPLDKHCCSYMLMIN